MTHSPRSERPRVAALFIAAGLLACGSVAHMEGGDRFRARLSMVPIDISMRTAIAGVGAATADVTGSTLKIVGSFEGLRSPAVSAQLHEGSKKGLRGPALFPLTITHDTKGTIAGSIELTSAHLAALRAGHCYIELSSEKAPDGNLWGWLLPDGHRP
ncbi:MAG TPA: CHRD domain-containing protein [Vicinamibacterales bacterium]|jgi:hypothetical protein|nr:CHRD domain-containing protein [Vicinamibacterales bacterium]